MEGPVSRGLPVPGAAAATRYPHGHQRRAGRGVHGHPSPYGCRAADAVTRSVRELQRRGAHRACRPGAPSDARARSTRSRVDPDPGEPVGECRRRGRTRPACARPVHASVAHGHTATRLAGNPPLGTPRRSTAASSYSGRPAPDSPPERTRLIATAGFGHAGRHHHHPRRPGPDQSATNARTESAHSTISGNSRGPAETPAGIGRAETTEARGLPGSAASRAEHASPRAATTRRRRRFECATAGTEYCDDSSAHRSAGHVESHRQSSHGTRRCATTPNGFDARITGGTRRRVQHCIRPRGHARRSVLVDTHGNPSARARGTVIQPAHLRPEHPDADTRPRATSTNADRVHHPRGTDRHSRDHDNPFARARGTGIQPAHPRTPGPVNDTRPRATSTHSERANLPGSPRHHARALHSHDAYIDDGTPGIEGEPPA